MRTHLLHEVAAAPYDAHVLNAVADTSTIDAPPESPREIARWAVLNDCGRVYRIVETAGSREFVRFLIEMRARNFRDALPVDPEHRGFEAVFRYRPKWRAAAA